MLLRSQLPGVLLKITHAGLKLLSDRNNLICFSLLILKRTFIQFAWVVINLYELLPLTSLLNATTNMNTAQKDAGFSMNTK